MPPTIDEIMQRLPAVFDASRAQGVRANVQFDFTSDGGKKYRGAHRRGEVRRRRRRNG